MIYIIMYKKLFVFFNVSHWSSKQITSGKISSNKKLTVHSHEDETVDDRRIVNDGQNKSAQL